MFSVIALMVEKVKGHLPLPHHSQYYFVYIVRLELKQTSLFAENFSQAVTHSSIASVRISSFISEY